MNCTYCYCKVCAIKVPQIHSGIHINDCHSKKKKKIVCKKLHPYIKNGEMMSQIQVILKNSSEKKNDVTLGKWLTAKEPEYMKSFQYEFTDKFAFFSEFDIHHSRIKNFGAVLLQTDSVENIFIAVAEKSQLQPIGTVRIYEKVFNNYFPIQSDCLFVTAKRINKIEEAKKIRLKVGNEVDKTLLFCDIKSKFCTCSGHGWPYLFKKSGIIRMTNLMGEAFDASYDVDEDDVTYKSFISDSFQSPGSYSSKSNLYLNATTESFKSLLLEDGGTKNSDENIEMAFVTENKPLQKSKSFVRSSTPTRETELCKLSRSKEKVNNNNNLSLTSSQISCIDPVNSDVYYWLSHDTLIEIVSPNNEMQSELFVRKNSENSFKKLSSYFYKNKQYYLLKEMLMKKLNQSEKNPLNSWSAILLLGLPGTGKTTLIKELCSELNLHLKVANMLDYSRSPDFSTYIDNCFQQTIERAPSVLFFDQFDSFGQKNSEFSSKILKNLRSLKMSEKSVIIIGATDRPDLVSSRVRQVGRFDKEIILNLPDKNERTEIIFQMLNNYMNNIQEEKIKLLGELCIGFTYADIQYAFGTASLNARISYEKAHKSYPKDEDVCLEFECLESTMKSTVPSILRDKDYAAPRVRWEDIFGYEDKKAKLKQIATDVSRGDYSKGILFYGPPGCSKTMFAKALATETQFTFFTIKCSDLLSKYVGETEKGLNKVIEKAFLSSPALVFMDEIDSLCGSRDGTGGSESSIVPELLSVMRKAHNIGNILFVGATNRPHVLDENLLGAGYFDLTLHFDLPNCATRCAIWEGILKEVPKGSISVPTLCQKTEGFTCVEIESIFEKAAYSLIESHYLNLEESPDSNDSAGLELIVTEELILQTISSTFPRTSKALLDDINAFASTRRRT